MRIRDFLEDLLHWSAGRLWLKRIGSVVGVALSVMGTFQHFNASSKDADRSTDAAASTDDGASRAPASLDEAVPESLEEASPVARALARIGAQPAPASAREPDQASPQGAEPQTFLGAGPTYAPPAAASAASVSGGSMQVMGGAAANPASGTAVSCDSGGNCYVEANPEGGGGEVQGFNGSIAGTPQGTTTASPVTYTSSGGGGGGGGTSPSTGSGIIGLGGPSVTFVGSSGSNDEVTTGSIVSGDQPLMDEERQ